MNQGMHGHKHLTRDYHQLACACALDKTRLSEAVQHSRLAVEAEPGNALYYAFLGRDLAQVGRIHEGVDMLSRAAQMAPENPEKLLETHINIGGLAPSDLEVASYIEQLSNSSLLDKVALVESMEFKLQDSTLRQFKLSAMLRKNVHLTKEDIKGIKDKAENTVWNF